MRTSPSGSSSRKAWRHAGNNRFDNFTLTGTALPGITVDPDPEPTDRERWNAFYGLTGEDALDEADPDGDGIANLFERAMFLDPTTADDGLPATSANRPETIGFTYRVAKGQSDITLSVLATYTLDDPESWTMVEPVGMDDSPPDYILYRVELPTSEPAGFLRLRATR